MEDGRWLCLFESLASYDIGKHVFALWQEVSLEVTLCLEWLFHTVVHCVVLWLCTPTPTVMLCPVWSPLSTLMYSSVVHCIVLCSALCGCACLHQCSVMLYIVLCLSTLIYCSIVPCVVAHVYADVLSCCDPCGCTVVDRTFKCSY